MHEWVRHLLLNLAARGASLDAVLIDGSDAAGTVLAADRFLAMIKDLPKYVPPEKQEKMEVDDTPDPHRLRKNP